MKKLQKQIEKLELYAACIVIFLGTFSMTISLENTLQKDYCDIIYDKPTYDDFTREFTSERLF